MGIRFLICGITLPRPCLTTPQHLCLHTGAALTGLESCPPSLPSSLPPAAELAETRALRRTGRRHDFAARPFARHA